MNEECVVARYGSITKSERAIRSLLQAGFSAAHISIVVSPLDNKFKLATRVKIGNDSIREAAIVAGLGDILALLSGSAIILCSAAGFLVFLVGWIVGAATGSGTGELLGGMIDWGVPAEAIRSYERSVRNGMVLVVVKGNHFELAHAERVLRETKASEVNLHVKSDFDAPDERGD